MQAWLTPKSFKAKKKAIGSKIVKSVSPGQMVIKIVNDVLKELLGTKEEPINLKATPPVIILMVGLQGSGKTTITARTNPLDKTISPSQFGVRIRIFTGADSGI